MKSILEEFAYGNINPNERFFKPNSPYGKAMKTLSDIEEKLRVKLNDSERELLNDFVNVQLEINSLSSVNNLIYGYRLGVLMTMEVFAGKEDLLVGGEGWQI